MNVEIVDEAAQFPEKEYINGVTVAVWASFDPTNPTPFYIGPFGPLTPQLTPIFYWFHCNPPNRPPFDPSPDLSFFESTPVTPFGPLIPPCILVLFYR